MRRHELTKRALVEAVLLLHLHRADVIRALTCQSLPLNGHSFGREFARPLVRMQYRPTGSFRGRAAHSLSTVRLAVLLATGMLIGLLAGLLGVGGGIVA